MALKNELQAKITLEDKNFVKTVNKLEAKIEKFSEKVENSWKKIKTKGFDWLENKIKKTTWKVAKIKNEIGTLWQTVNTWGLRKFSGFLKWILWDSTKLLSNFKWITWVWTIIGSIWVAWFNNIKEREDLEKKAVFKLWRERWINFTNLVEKIQLSKPEKTYWEIAEANYSAFQAWIFKTKWEQYHNGIDFVNLADQGIDTNQLTNAILAVKSNYWDLPNEKIIGTIISGMQNWGNLRGDLLETVSEFSEDAKKFWLTFEQFISNTTEAMKKGALSSDLYANTLQENNVKMSDLFSWTAQDRSKKFNELWIWDINIENLNEQYQKWLMNRKQISKYISDKGKNLNKSQRIILNEALYGTQWEDLGLELMTELTDNKFLNLWNENKTQPLNDLRLKSSISWKISDFKSFSKKLKQESWKVVEWITGFLWNETYREKLWEKNQSWYFWIKFWLQEENENEKVNVTNVYLSSEENKRQAEKQQTYYINNP